MSFLIRKKISNHSVLTDIERYAIVDSVQPVASTQSVTANVVVEHEKQGHVVAEMRKVVQLQTSNAVQRLDRELETFAPVKDEEGNDKMIGGYDLMMKFMNAGVPVPALLDFFVANADAEKEFD